VLQYKRLTALDIAPTKPGKLANENIGPLSDDLYGIGMMIIDGVVCFGRSRNTPPAERLPQII